MKKDKKNNSDKDAYNSDKGWVITVLFITFFLSLLFSYISTTSISSIGIIPATLILLFVVLLGIFFDIIATAVTVAKEQNFHAKAAKKIDGAKKAIKIIRNSTKVANFCADVIGDIAGVLSGALSSMIALKITQYYNLSFDLQFLISAFVASLTVSGKAIGKSIAKKYDYEIVDKLSKVFNFFGNLKNKIKNKLKKM